MCSQENNIKTYKIKSTPIKTNIHIRTRKLLSQTPTWPCICLHFFNVVILQADDASSMKLIKTNKNETNESDLHKKFEEIYTIIGYKKSVSESWSSQVRQVLDWPRKNRQRCRLTSSFLLPLVVMSWRTGRGCRLRRGQRWRRLRRRQSWGQKWQRFYSTRRFTFYNGWLVFL